MDRPGSPHPPLVARALACVRGGRTLFAPVDFTLDHGESLLLCGGNGAGKSSLIRMIAGLLPVMCGTLHVDVPRALCDENLAMDTDAPLVSALRFWTMMSGGDTDATDRAIRACALDHLRDVPVRMFSTGQRKRAMIARVVASGAPLWLLDEPGNGLDPLALDRLGALMTDHVGRGGMIVAASHFGLPFSFTRTLALHPAAPDGDAETDGGGA